MMKIEQVLWDWNGTLLDDLEYSIQVRNNIFPAFHLPTLSGVEEYHRQFTFPVRLYYQRAGVTDEIFDDVAHAWMAEYERRMDTIPLHGDAVETVERFRRAGLGQTVLSASEQTMLRRQLALHGLDSRFDAILGRGDIYAGKQGSHWTGIPAKLRDPGGGDRDDRRQPARRGGGPGAGHPVRAGGAGPSEPGNAAGSRRARGGFPAESRRLGAGAKVKKRPV